MAGAEAPGGTLVIGTPDYATLGWRIIEPIYGSLMPGGYRDEHITHYTQASLTSILTRHGFIHEENVLYRAERANHAFPPACRRDCGR